MRDNNRGPVFWLRLFQGTSQTRCQSNLVILSKLKSLKLPASRNFKASLLSHFNTISMCAADVCLLSDSFILCLTEPTKSLWLRGMKGNYKSSTSCLMNFILPLPPLLTWLASYKELPLNKEEFLLMRETKTSGNTKKLNNFLQKGLPFQRGKFSLIALVCTAPT